MHAKGINWDAQPLGEVTDKQLAKKLGVTQPAVWYARTCRGIRPFRVGGEIERLQTRKERAAEHMAAIPVLRRRWTKEQLAMLGKCPDAQVGIEVGVSTSSVFQKRKSLGIPAYRR